MRLSPKVNAHEKTTYIMTPGRIFPAHFSAQKNAPVFTTEAFVYWIANISAFLNMPERNTSSVMTSVNIFR